MRAAFGALIGSALLTLVACQDDVSSYSSVRADTSTAEADLSKPYTFDPERGFSLPRLSEVVNHVREHLEHARLDHGALSGPQGKAPVPEHWRQSIRTLSKQAFGNPDTVTIRAVSCDAYEAISMNLRSREVEACDAFIRQYAGDQYNAAITTILAHELSHYIIELYRANASRNCSPHGLSCDHQPESDIAHAEVDATAVALMQQLKIDHRPLAAFLKAEFGAESGDLKVRLKFLEKLDTL